MVDLKLMVELISISVSQMQKHMQKFLLTSHYV